jgi:hypothetical protein
MMQGKKTKHKQEYKNKSIPVFSLTATDFYSENYAQQTVPSSVITTTARNPQPLEAPFLWSKVRA